MNYFNRELSREIGFRSGLINHKFGSRYHASIVSTLAYYQTVYKYIYRNPIRAGICQRVEEYPFSSIRFLVSGEKYLFPIYDTYFENIEDHWRNLSWLNSDYEKEINSKIRRALKGTYFELYL
jgi:hypothetical protein